MSADATKSVSLSWVTSVRVSVCSKGHVENFTGLFRDLKRDLWHLWQDYESHDDWRTMDLHSMHLSSQGHFFHLWQCLTDNKEHSLRLPLHINSIESSIQFEVKFRIVRWPIPVFVEIIFELNPKCRADLFHFNIWADVVAAYFSKLNFPASKETSEKFKVVHLSRYTMNSEKEFRVSCRTGLFVWKQFGRKGPYDRRGIVGF